MNLPASAPDSLYQQLVDLPEGLVGEIIDGQLYTQPRPAGPHAIASSTLIMDVGAAFHRGRGGPGGWWILDEPELHFVRDTEVAVPDIAGWRRERLPRIPRDQRFEIAPDWICEVLSPNTAKHDRIVKMPLYARYGVAFLWLVDPLARTLEAYALQNGHWSVIGQFKDQDEAIVEPFAALTLALADLWVEVED
jgi:Uma2 family endonuclease